MACDASLPGHPIHLPHECVDEEERYQIQLAGEDLSLCHYHYNYLASIVLSFVRLAISRSF